jgi:tripartite-type tricarboxylate transporter receptor subunit TctC
MTILRRGLLCLAVGAAALPALPHIAQGQAYPSRPITMIVPFPPGGLTDVVARIVVEGMRGALGQPVIIENVGGASGSIGTGRVARAAPDGYTVVLGIWNTHVANAVTYALQYDVVNDFEPVALLADAPMLLVAKKAVPANDVKELIAWLKANPNKSSMGTVGSGSPPHLLGLLVQQQTGTQFGLVAYRGAGPLIQDLVAGHIDMTFANPATAMPQVRAGNIKALALTGKNRLAMAPEVATVGEAGLPELQISLWAGLFAPKGTPKPIIARLNAAAAGVFADPTVRQKLTDQGIEIPPPDQQTPDALAAYQKSEINRWWPIIKAAGIKGE